MGRRPSCRRKVDKRQGTSTSPWTALVAGLVHLSSRLSTATAQHVPHHRKLLIGNANGVIKDQYIVQFVETFDSTGLETKLASLTERRASRLGVTRPTVLQSFDQLFRGVSISGLAADLLTMLLEDDDVLTVEPDRELTLHLDEMELSTWGLDRISKIDVSWSNDSTLVQSGYGVTVHILDSGIRKSHREFGGRAYCSLDLFEPYDCNDAVGHGTAVAAILGGESYGVAKNVTISSVKVVNRRGRGRVSNLLAGLEFVVQAKELNPHEPMIATLALASSRSSLLNDAIDRAVEAGLIVITGAGNGNSNACNFSPGGARKAITVGATSRNDRRYKGSNYGACVNIFAPGQDILTASPTSDTASRTLSGSSMAVPHVVGAAAMLLELHPSWTSKELLRRVQSRATQGSIWNVGVGSNNAMLNTADLAPVPTAAPSTAPSVAPSVALSATPSVTRSAVPTTTPSVAPSVIPSATRSVAPSAAPSIEPSAAPSVASSEIPSVFPSGSWSATPSSSPTNPPSLSDAPSLSSAPTTEFAELPLHINCGDARRQYTSVADNTIWQEDRFYVNGSTYTKVRNYGNTMDHVLMHTERFGDGEPLLYEVPVPNGLYSVELQFAEMYFDRPLLRVFDVYVEENLVIADFDLIETAGRKYRTIVETFVVQVDDESLSLAFAGSTENGKINAIAVDAYQLRSL